MSDPATVATLGEWLVKCLPFVVAAAPEVGKWAAHVLDDASAAAVVESRHLAQKGFGAVRDRLVRYAHEERKPPANHDLERALYISFLYATEAIYHARLTQLGHKIELSWLAGVKRELLSRLPDSSPVQLRLKEGEVQELRRKIEEIRRELAVPAESLQPCLPFGLTPDLLRRLSVEASPKGLLDVILEDSRWYRDTSQNLKDLARQSLWSYMSRFFAEEIKTNPRVQRILMAELLADTGISLEDVKSELRGVSTAIEALEAQVGALRDLIRAECEKQFHLVDERFLEKQRHVQLQTLVRIPLGDWACVIQDRSVDRDAARAIVARVLQTPPRAVFQIIRGEPGSGKTTALLQIGAMLVERGCVVLEVLEEANLSDLRTFVKRFASTAHGRVFVLIDDAYKEDRGDTLINLLSNPGEPLPVTVIATTPSYADRTAEIGTNSYLEVLPPVSPDRLSDGELNDLRRLLSAEGLSRTKFRQLTQSRRILPVMLQLSGGEPLKRVILAAARRIEKTHTAAYHAWGLVTTFGRWNLRYRIRCWRPCSTDPASAMRWSTTPSAWAVRG